MKHRLAYNEASSGLKLTGPLVEEAIMEFMTVTGTQDGRRYIAIYRKWFNEKLSAWELNMVPGTLRWLN